MLGKVLVITNNYSPVSERINWGFLDKLRMYCDEYNRVKILHYKMKYDFFWYLMTPQQLMDEYKPDVVIAYLEYHPQYHQKAAEFIRQLNCPKIWVTVDAPFKYGYETYDKYFQACGFDFGIMRAWLEQDRHSVWLPYSVDELDFHPAKEPARRMNRVGFAGTIWHDAYETRQKCLLALKENHLLFHEQGFRVTGDEYPRFMRKCKLGFTTCEFGNSRAKMYEYMASGAALLSQPFDESRKLFDERCWHEYTDENDVVEKTEQLLRDPYLMDYLADTAHSQILKHHTDAKRINQFYITIKHFLEGKPIPQFFRR